MVWYQTVDKLKGVLPSEIVATSYWIGEEIKYIISYSKVKDLYYLYEVGADNKAIKTKDKAKTPIDLEKKIHLEGM